MEHQGQRYSNLKRPALEEKGNKLIPHEKISVTCCITIRLRTLTRLRTLPRGVESKKDIGARNNELSSWENKDLDDWIPRATTVKDLDSKKIIVQAPIIMYTEINFSVLT